MSKDFKTTEELYQSLKENRTRYMPLWNDIAKFVGINVDPGQFEGNDNVGEKRDESVDDPTAALSVNQAGDYLQGVVWGTGDNAIELEPSEYVLDLADESSVSNYFKFASNTTLTQMNHSRAGLNASQKSFFYDEMSFGTAGIGAFKNRAFEEGIEDNALIFRPYGVDCLAIDEGKSGLVDIIFVNYKWRTNRIVQEFAFPDGVLDKTIFGRLPKKIQADYKNGKTNTRHTIIHGVLPREDYDPKLQGKRGARYKGIWFSDDEKNNIFFEEDYKTIPIAVCRAIKLRGEVFGRASGTMLISSIKSLNYMFSKGIEVIEKMADTPLGTWNSALFGDSVLDTSAGGLSVFNQSVLGQAKEPVFPLLDVKDPTPLINFLIPYLNDKITTGFKVDVLLDFSSAKDMTATESMQRYAIRGRSLSGMLQQIKVEQQEPLIHRCVSLLSDMGVLGINPYEASQIANQLAKRGKTERIIPDAVLQCIAEGKPWYRVKFNNELERLSRTEAIERIMHVLNGLGMIAQMFPAILEGVEWFDLWKDINKFLGTDYAINEKEFKQKMMAMMQKQQEAMQIEMGKGKTEAAKNIGTAENQRAQAQRVS